MVGLELALDLGQGPKALFCDGHEQAECAGSFIIDCNWVSGHWGTLILGCLSQYRIIGLQDSCAQTKVICTISASCDLNLVVPLISLSQVPSATKSFRTLFLFPFSASSEYSWSCIPIPVWQIWTWWCSVFLKAVMLFYYWAIDHQGNVDQLVLS